MPENDPSLSTASWTPEQGEQIGAWLTKKWTPTRTCFQCGATAWTATAHPVFLQIGQVGIGLTVAAFPCVAVICQNCGNTILVNAIIAGIVSPPDAKEVADANK